MLFFKQINKYDNELFVYGLGLDANRYFFGFKLFLTAFHRVFRILSDLTTSYQVKSK